VLRWGKTDIADTLDELVEPKSTALIMWDYATGLVDRAFNRDEFVKCSARLLKAARAANIPVLYSRQSDMTWEDIGPGLIRLRMRQMNVRSDKGFKSLNAKGAAAGEFVRAIAPKKNDVVFDKFLPNAFSGTNLAWRLQAHGIQTLVLAGISLETGIDGTAREAVNRGYYAVIARDAVSSTSKRRYELAMPLIEELNDVFDCDEIAAVWQAAGKADSG
jgi:nicotinamidase-related amidase